MRPIFTPEKLAAIQADIAAGLKHREIGAKHNIHISSVSKVKRGVIGKVATPTKALAPAKKGNLSKYAQFIPQMHALREQKYTQRAIGEKLGIPWHTVAYHLSKKQNTSSPEGASQNGHINKHVAVGIAYAETERFIGVLAQRLGVPTDLLRSRLSELLGRSPIR